MPRSRRKWSVARQLSSVLQNTMMRLPRFCSPVITCTIRHNKKLMSTKMGHRQSLMHLTVDQMPHRPLKWQQQVAQPHTHFIA